MAPYGPPPVPPPVHVNPLQELTPPSDTTECNYLLMVFIGALFLLSL